MKRQGELCFRFFCGILARKSPRELNPDSNGKVIQEYVRDSGAIGHFLHCSRGRGFAFLMDHLCSAWGTHGLGHGLGFELWKL